MIAVGIGKNTNGVATMDNGDLPKRRNACEARGDSKSATARAALPFLTGLLTKHFIPAMPQRGEPMLGARHVANSNKDLTLLL